MGSGLYSSETYKRATVTRSLRGESDFQYSDSNPERVHPDLDPLRINKKKLGKLESRDSEEHPNSLAIIVDFDVTGSNYSRAKVAQKKLNKLMDGITAVLPDAQIAVWANDDVTCPYPSKIGASMQMSEFESDNRIDDELRNIILVRAGGSNRFESYDLVLYGAAYKTAIDCAEKRGLKGYLFIYADEPFPDYTKKTWIKEVFGDDVDDDIPIEKLIEDARKLYNVYILWPEGGYMSALDQQRKLFGKEYVIELQDPDMIVEAIISRVQLDAKKEAEALAAVK